MRALRVHRHVALAALVAYGAQQHARYLYQLLVGLSLNSLSHPYITHKTWTANVPVSRRRWSTERKVGRFGTLSIF
jgi:hypothetical protein